MSGLHFECEMSDLSLGASAQQNRNPEFPRKRHQRRLRRAPRSDTGDAWSSFYLRLLWTTKFQDPKDVRTDSASSNAARLNGFLSILLCSGWKIFRPFGNYNWNALWSRMLSCIKSANNSQWSLPNSKVRAPRPSHVDSRLALRLIYWRRSETPRCHVPAQARELSLLGSRNSAILFEVCLTGEERSGEGWNPE